MHTTTGPIACRTDNLTHVGLCFGVPFAAPPVGERRFSPPVPHNPWTTARSAKAHGHCCVPGVPSGASLGEEDCLFLDMYLPPATAQPEPPPILVFFYGGGFLEGCISMYDATNLSATSGAIVVLVNYRLGVLGYLALPEWLGAGRPTNFGLLDQQMALQWVNANAQALGGDVGRVTIFGQSAGGASVSYHLIMPKSRGLFQAAILQSPGGRKGWVQTATAQDSDALTREELLYNGVALVESRGCGSTPGAARLACLRNLSVAQLLAEPNYGRFAPGVDGASVTAIPLHAIRAGAWASQVHVIVGSTSCESCAGEGMLLRPGKPRPISDASFDSMVNATFSPSRFRRPVAVTPAKVLAWYAPYRADRGNWQTFTRIASDDGHACNTHLLAAALLATSNATVRRYEFRAAGGHPGQEFPGAVHASDLQYVFRSTRPAPYAPEKLSPEQDSLGSQMQHWWRNLVSTHGRLVGWPACTPGRPACDQVMLLDTPATSLGTEADVDDGSASLHCCHWQEFM